MTTKKPERDSTEIDTYETFAEAVAAMLKRIGPPPGGSDDAGKKVRPTLH